MTDRILAIGLDAQHERIDAAEFSAVAPLTEYSAVVLDPASVTALWSHVVPGVDRRLLADSETDGGLGNTLVEVIRRRRREAAELLAAGGLLVCVLRPVGTPLHVRRRGPRGEGAAILHAYSWLPGDSALARLVINAEQEPGIFDFRLPIFDWDKRAARVPSSEQVGPVESAVGNRQSAIVADACVGNEQLDPRWRVLATDRLGRPVALEVAVGEGRVLFVPPIAARDPAERGTLLVSHFAPSQAPEAPQAAQETPEPDWLAGCLLPRQAELGTRVGQLQSDVDRLQAELAQARLLHGELVGLGKLLYAARAAELADPVASALRRFGFDVVKLDAECLEAQSPEGRALVALAVSDGMIDSDPYWALLRRLDEQTPPAKGVIVGNAYCAARPGTRGIPFSDILHRGAQHREICLVSCTELHAAVEAALQRPEDEALAVRVRTALLQSTGPCRLTPILGPSEPLGT